MINTQNGLCELDLTHVDWLSGDKHSQVQYSPDGTALVSVTPANVVIVRDAETGRLRFPAIHPVVERGPCRTIAVSPDSRWLATGVTGKNVVQVWNLATGQPAGPALPHPGDFYGIFAVEFSPDGQWILSGHKDGRMRLWDWKAGNLVCPPMQHPGEVYDVKFTADGRYALAAVRLSTVHVWDLATGKLVAAPVRYEVPPGGATSGLGIAGSQVIASAPGYPVLDLSMLLSEPDAEIESLLAQAELSSNQKLQLGELVTLEQSEWNERWVTYATSRLTPEAAAEALARTLDESPNASARQMIAERAARTNLLERLLKLRPDVPQLHVVLAHELARKGDRTSAAKHRKIAVEAFQQSLGERLPDPSMASELARLMIEDLPLNWAKLEPTEMKAESGCTFTRQPDGSILAGPSTSQFDSYTIQCRNSLRRIAALRLDVLPHASLPGGGPGWVVGLFHLTELRAALRRADGTTVPLGIRSAASNKVRPLDDHTTTLQDGPWGVLDDNHATHWDIWPFAGMPHWLTLQFADPFEIAEADELIVQLEFRDPKHSGVRIGCFQLSVSGEEHVVETQQLIAAIRENAVSGVDALAAAHLVTGNSARAVDLLQPTVALARQNEAGTRLLLLAKAQHKLGQPAAARESCDQLIEWLRTNTPPRMLQQLTAEVVTEIGGLDRKQFHALLAQSVIEQELARLTREIETAPNSAAMYFARGQYLAQIGRWHASADDYQHEVKLIPENRLTWMYAAPVLILAGDEQGYRQHCRAMVTQFQGATDVGVADTVCKISLLLPDVIELSELPIQNMRDAASDPKWAAVRQYSQATCALISYREGNYEESIAWTKKLPNLTGHSGTLALVVRAMAEHQLGQADQSRKTLAQVETLIPIELRTVGTPEYIGPLPVPRANAHHDWLIAEVLRREAAALINGEPPKKD